MKTEMPIIWSKIKLRNKTYLEIPTPYGNLDLHAFAVFNELKFNVEKSQVSLQFIPWKENEFQVPSGEGNILQKAKLIFEDVHHFHIEKRDDTMPAEEDMMLQHYVAFEHDEDKVGFVFEFNSGREIIIIATNIKVALYAKDPLKKMEGLDLELV